MKTISEALQRRYATKKYDATKKVSAEDLNTILEAMRFAPSSFWVQAWKFMIIENSDLRAKLREASRGQSQITDASHLIVLTVRNDYTETDADEYMASVATTRNIPVEALAGFKWAIMWAVGHLDTSSKQVWNSKQAYIALGFGLMTAAQMWIDTTPMEWFDANTYNQILWLQDYSTAVVLAVWYRASDDETQHYAKVRFDADKVIEFIK
jgi:nitroreductase